MWCVCESAKGRFQQDMEEQGHEETKVAMTQNIEMSEKVIYSVTTEISGAQPTVSEVSHVSLCKNNGVMVLESSFNEAFDCSCEHNVHCRGRKQIQIRVKDSNGEQFKPYKKPLFCSKLDSGPSTSKMATQPIQSVHASPASFLASKLDPILQQHAPRPHRPGKKIIIMSLRLPFFPMARG